MYKREYIRNVIQLHLVEYYKLSLLMRFLLIALYALFLSPQVVTATGVEAQKIIPTGSVKVYDTDINAEKWAACFGVELFFSLENLQAESDEENSIFENEDTEEDDDHSLSNNKSKVYSSQQFCNSCYLKSCCALGFKIPLFILYKSWKFDSI